MSDKSYICSTCEREHDTISRASDCFNSHEPKLTGGSSSYYTVTVDRPTSGGAPYVAECNDIIEALNMEYDVANAFKAAWRIAALRQGKGKPGQDNPTYDAEKVVFFGNRIIERSK
jgi:hypothetical protein